MKGYCWCFSVGSWADCHRIKGEPGLFDTFEPIALPDSQSSHCAWGIQPCRFFQKSMISDLGMFMQDLLYRKSNVESAVDPPVSVEKERDILF